MTETEWLACTDPRHMLKFLKKKITDRKVRLFACACCRRVWKDIRPAANREAIEVAEQYADGSVSAEQLNDALGKARKGRKNLAELATCWVDGRAHGLGKIPFQIAKHVAWTATGSVGSITAKQAINAEFAAQIHLLQCVAGNPFRPVILPPAQRSSTAIALAQGIYDQRAFDRLPILADALEDAGCTNAEILEHCRQPGVHTRGCWVVDLVLGKE